MSIKRARADSLPRRHQILPMRDNSPRVEAPPVAPRAKDVAVQVLALAGHKTGKDGTSCVGCSPKIDPIILQRF